MNIPIMVQQGIKFLNALTTKAGSIVLNFMIQGISNDYAEDVKNSTVEFFATKKFGLLGM